MSWRQKHFETQPRPKCPAYQSKASRNTIAGSGPPAADQTVENCFDAEGEQRPGTADRRPGTADRRPGTAGSMSHSVRSLKSGKSTLDATQTYWKGNPGNYLG